MSSKAYEFDEIANGPFFPIYSEIANQIKERTGICDGTCIDIGSGGGHLGLSYAKITNVEVALLDLREDAINIANKRAKEWKLWGRASAILGDVQQMPFKDEAVNLCISRGSVWFWENQSKGFSEIYRVLNRGGKAYIGGGFGNKELKEQIDSEMKKRDSEWPKSRQQFVEGNSTEHFYKVLKEAGISDFEIIDDDSGIWVLFEK